MEMIKHGIKHWHGLILTASVLMILHLFQFTPTLALAYIPLAYTAYHAGLWPAVSCAVLISIYALVQFPLDRTLQISLAAFLIAIPMGWLQHRARLSDTINGHISKVREIRLLTRFIIKHRSEMNDGLIFRLLEEIEDRAGNLEALIHGWRQLQLETRETEAKFKQGYLARIEKEIRDGENYAGAKTEIP